MMTKRFVLLTAGLLAGEIAFSQSTYVQINDTRNYSSSPNEYNQEIRGEFKLRTAMGISGTSLFGGQLTIAPWADVSGNNIHQFGFIDEGLFYRQGTQGVNTWHPWTKLLTSTGLQNVNGKLFLSHADDDLLTLQTTETNSWAYMQFLDPTKRTAYFGVSTANNLEIAKEHGGNIALVGGNVGIGTLNPIYELSVAGTVGAKKVKVTATGWPDYVFKDDYKLMGLYELEQFVKKHHHLPEIPDEHTVVKEGVDLGDINKQLLQKVEELSLYLIEHQKELDKLKAANEVLQKEITELKSRL